VPTTDVFSLAAAGNLGLLCRGNLDLPSIRHDINLGLLLTSFGATLAFFSRPTGNLGHDAVPACSLELVMLLLEFADLALSSAPVAFQGLLRPDGSETRVTDWPGPSPFASWRKVGSHFCVVDRLLMVNAELAVVALA
jgi:hypothetical protein